jgi:sulfur-carrier protein
VGVTVLLPGLLADQAGGQKSFELDAPTVGAALRALPVRDLLFDERGDLRPLVNVYLDGEDVRGMSGIDTELRSGSTVRVVAAVAGG